MMIQKRKFDAINYHFGFNAQEHDREAKGQGNSVEFTYRTYDSRLSKFLSVDPLFSDYPFYTPYQFAANQPIHAVDLEGLESSDDKNPTLVVLGKDNKNGFSDNNKQQVECLLKTLNSSQVFQNILNNTKNVKAIYIYDKGTLSNVEEWRKNTPSSVSSGTNGYIGLPQNSVNDNPSTLTTLVYEVTNIQNMPKYEQLNKKAKAGSISKENFVKGQFQLEALAVFSALEFQDENPEADDGKYTGFKKFYDMYKNGEEYEGVKITKQVLLNVIAHNIEAQNPNIKSQYEDDFDNITKEKKDE
jgi:RHS repeat-associated protein